MTYHYNDKSAFEDDDVDDDNDDDDVVEDEQEMMQGEATQSDHIAGK